MLLSRSVGMLSVSLIVLSAGVVSAQDPATGSGQAFPNKPIRIVTRAPGGGSDLAARTVAQGISGPLGQQVIVDYRGEGFLSAAYVAKSPPDGYTLLLGSTSLWIGPLLQKAPYDTLTDFSPISLTTRSPLLLVVHPSLPAKSVKELIALAKAKPGQLNYSTTSIGASTHLSAELFKAMAAVNIVRISYKTTSMQQADLLSGQVQLSFGSGPSMAVHVKSGRLRGLAVTSAEPSPLLPGFPTVAASGVPGYEFEAIDGILAPAKTPAAIINRLNQEMVRFLNSPEAKERLLPSGVEASGSSPEQLAARIKTETAVLGKVIKDAGIRVD